MEWGLANEHTQSVVMPYLYVYLNLNLNLNLEGLAIHAQLLANNEGKTSASWRQKSSPCNVWLVCCTGYASVNSSADTKKLC